MSLPAVFYADSFQSAYEYTVYQLTPNKGSQTCITKEGLLEIATENSIEVFSYMKKEDIVRKVYGVLGQELLKYCKHTGVPAFPFMNKYRLLPGEVEDFAKVGLLKMTGDMKVYYKGKRKIVNLYSAEQYFSLSEETVTEWRRIVGGKR